MPGFGLPFVVLNFADPLTPAQLDQIVALTGNVIDNVIEVSCQIDLQKPLIPQIAKIADVIGLTNKEWNTYDFVVNLPFSNFVAAAMLAEIYGRTGYLPKILLWRDKTVSGVIDLCALADSAKYRR